MTNDHWVIGSISQVQFTSHNSQLTFHNWAPSLSQVCYYPKIGGQSCSRRSFCSKPSLTQPEGRSYFAALTAEAACCFTLVRGMAVVSPFLPADVEFFSEKSVLCQLQSNFGRERSIVTPTVGDDLLVRGQRGSQLIQFIDRCAECSRNMT